MRAFKILSGFAEKYFAILIIIFSVTAFLQPDWFKPFSPLITLLLGFVMFTMGLTLKASDFKLVFTKPIPVIIGIVSQFSIMPSVAFLISIVFRLPAEIAAGLILLGSVPGGTSSNVMTYLAKGNVPLSITMTSVSTLLAPIVTPLLLLLLAGQWMPVDPITMFKSIIQVILIPIMLGIIVNKLVPAVPEKGASILPFISIVAIIIIVSSIIGANKTNIASAGFTVFIAVFLHNGIGYLLGYFAGKLTKLPEQDCRTNAIEVGIQNSGLGVALAAAHLSPLAALPSAFASAWQVVTGTFLAQFWSTRAPYDEEVASDEKTKKMS